MLKCEGLESQLINEVTGFFGVGPGRSLGFQKGWTHQYLGTFSSGQVGTEASSERQELEGSSASGLQCSKMCCFQRKILFTSFGTIVEKTSSNCGGRWTLSGVRFVPTRLNPADDPTRDVPLRGSIPGMDLAAWDRTCLFSLASCSKLRRWSSNWVRLVLCVLGPSVLSCSDPGIFRRPQFPYGLACLGFEQDLHSASSMEFDATLGFPGEGPSTDFSLSVVLRFVLAFASLCHFSHGVLVPRNAGDFQRQLLRSFRPPLQEGRPVLQVTSNQRVSFLSQFETWLGAQGIDLQKLLAEHFSRIEELNKLLVKYGRVLYSVGRPYNHYAETINAIASTRPVVRRQLQEAWNLAFAWVRDEPSVHHIAMPWQILLASLTIALFWGWTDVAGMLALTFGALLRVGEFIGAVRKDLLLPCDTNHTNAFALLALKEPKTRFTAARHQSAKLDIPDLLRVTHLAFSKLRPLQKLWPRSGQTLRLRFKQVMAELGIDETIRLNGKTLDLGSLRPGGATWIQQTECGEFTRRRGRWLNQKVMEIYIQEISAFQFLAAVPLNSRQKIYSLCEIFPQVLLRAEEFWKAAIPTNVWYMLWKEQVNRE